MRIAIITTRRTAKSYKMRITFTCLLLAMCFLRLEAVSMSNMIPPIEGTNDVNTFYQTMKNLMKPFGCLEVAVGPELFELTMECLHGIFAKIKEDIISNNQIQIPSIKDSLTHFTTCRLEKYDLIDGETFSISKYLELYSSVNYKDSKPEDLEFISVSVSACQQEVKNDIATLPAVNGLLAFENCIIRKNIDHCTELSGRESVGLLLPVVYALNSLLEENNNCALVQPNSIMVEEYNMCLDIESLMYEAEESPGMGENPLNKIMAIVQAITQVPEIKCLKSVSVNLGLIKDDKVDYSAVAEFIGDLDGWSSDEVKNEVTSQVEECENDSDSTWQISLNFNMCFLPPFTDTCGLGNTLARDVLFPMSNEEFLSGVLQRLHDKFDLTEIMGLLPI